MERKNKKWYEVISSSASAKTQKEIATTLKNRLGKSKEEITAIGKRNREHFSIHNTEFTSYANALHHTKSIDKYDSVKKQSTGHLKDF